VTIYRHRPLVRGRLARFWATALVVAWLMFVREAAAQDLSKAPASCRVLIVVDGSPDPFMERVVAEVSAIRGLEVEIRRPVGALDADARAEHAQAAIRKVASGKGVEVWMADATSGRSLLRHLVVDESPGGPDQSLVALQTAELLRTSLLSSRGVAASGLAPPVVVSKASTAGPPSPPLPILDNAMQVGFGPFFSAGGVSTALQAWLSYQHLWSRFFGMVFDVSVPLLRGSLVNSLGSAHVGAVLAGGGFLVRWKSETGGMVASAILGGAFTSVLIKGQPAGRFEGSSPTVYSGLLYSRLSMAWNPFPWLGLGAAGMLGTTTSLIRIRFADRDVGEWGLPLAAAFLYGEVGWP